MKQYKSTNKRFINYKFFPSKELAQLVRKVFGPNLVSKCYYVIYNSGLEKEDLLALSQTKKEIVCEKGVLDYSCKDILIEFVNGNKVLFTNSEWATMKKMTGEINEAT